MQILGKLQKLENQTVAKSSPSQRQIGNARSPLSQKFVSIEKCVRAVEVGKSLGIAMVGIAGEDIASGNTTLVLGTLFNFMKPQFLLFYDLLVMHDMYCVMYDRNNSHVTAFTLQVSFGNSCATICSPC